MRAIWVNRKARAGLIILLIYGAMAVFGRWLVPLDLSSNFAERYQKPSLRHPFGTDYFGVDIFAQIVHGAGSVVGVTLLASLFAVALGALVGVARGYLGGGAGWLLDAVITVFLVVPTFPALLILAAFLMNVDLGPVGVAALIALFLWAPLAKQIAAQVLSTRAREFVEASRLLGMPLPYILFSDILRLLVPYLFVYFVLQLKAALEFSVGLMFLGLAKFDPTHWGVMLNYALYQAGALYTTEGYHYVFFVVGNILLLVFGGILLAQGVEEVFQPRLRSYE
ncbi:MAG: ABC transporter permease [Hydrogenibacillus schlegelii]|nr:ABC transporter permease [Hydrogenibacillus schlegelii]